MQHRMRKLASVNEIKLSQHIVSTHENIECGRRNKKKTGGFMFKNQKLVSVNIDLFVFSVVRFKFNR